MRKLLYVVAGAAALASASAASSAVVVTSATNLTNPDPTTSIFTSGGITTIMFGQPNITGPTYDGAFTFTNDDAGMYKIVVGSSTSRILEHGGDEPVISGGEFTRHVEP